MAYSEQQNADAKKRLGNNALASMSAAGLTSQQIQALAATMNNSRIQAMGGDFKDQNSARILSDPISRRLARLNMQGINPSYQGQPNNAMDNIMGMMGNPVGGLQGLAGNIGDLLSQKNPASDMSNIHRLQMGKQKFGAVKKMR